MRTISIVTAVHRDRSHHLAATYRSLAGQVLPDGWTWQWCLQEDGEGPQMTAEVLLDPHVDYSAFNEQQGAAMARNFALMRAVGDLCFMLDGDDLLDPGALDAVIAAFEAHPQAGWVAGPADDLFPDGSRKPYPLAALEAGLVEPGRVMQEFRRHAIFPFPAAMAAMRTSLLRAVGGFAAIPRAEDNMPFAAATEISWGVYLTTTLGCYRKWAEQSTAKPEFIKYGYEARRIIWQRALAVRDTLQLLTPELSESRSQLRDPLDEDDVSDS